MRDSRIEWTDHTFNPWWGCTKVSAGCAGCYAEAMSKRTGNRVWGDQAPRRFFGAHHWAQPLKWDAEARSSGRRARVFCASMADVFEDRQDLVAERERLWALIRATPHLDWLLLTKRAEHIAGMLPADWGNGFPNVWLGTTVEDKDAYRRISHLTETPAVVRFLSVEPMLQGLPDLWLQGIDWVIVGGESGPRNRRLAADWAREVRDACKSCHLPFFFKQWGGATPKSGGRELDGRTWEEYPRPLPPMSGVAARLVRALRADPDTLDEVRTALNRERP